MPRHAWTDEQDKACSELVGLHGATNWIRITDALNAQFGSSITSKQVKHRWDNFLNPDVKTGPWTEEEEAELFTIILNLEIQHAKKLVISIINHI